ncbi:ferritin family protein [bacterium]|nr:ferritin family protein [bacterium]
MGYLFRVSEVIETAVKIEKNGEEFYTMLREIADEDEVQEVFDFLANEEKKHIQIFEKMLEPLKKVEPQESYPGEYEGYLNSLAETHVFTRQDAGKIAAMEIQEPVEGIELALKFEEDSIRFFEGLGKFVPAADKAVVEALVKEEQKHIEILNKMKKKIEGR